MPRPKAAERWKPKVADQEILERIHDRFNYCVDRWEKIRKEAKEDMRHVRGDPWKPEERLARDKAKRPVIALDELGQYENQVVNDVRANPRAIKFSPVGDGANDKTALFYGNKTREIEYRSHAQQHYTRAFQNMVERSYGYCKIRTEYVTDKPAKPGDPWSAFNKRLVIDGVPDPDSIYPDPDFLDATGRDWKYLFEIESMTTKEFELAYPKAEITNFTPELIKYSQGWVTGKIVRVASYWELEQTQRTLQAWAFTDPNTGKEVVFELWANDEENIALAKSHGGTMKAERVVDDPHVCQYRTNGVEILKKTPWPGKWIPYYAFFGKMLWMDDGDGASELVIMSMTRLARDPNMLHAYYTSCEAEMIGITPKVPWWVWKGSLDKKNALKVQAANHEPVPYIEVDPLMGNGGNNQPTPSLPQRVPFEPPIQAIELGKEGARRAIQAAMGLTPLPTSAQRRNEKSGVALRQIEESGQRGSYHFIDSYDMGIERGGELLEDLIPKVHDTMGPTPVLLADKKPANVFINYGEQKPDTLPEKMEAIQSIDGLHAVTIDVGPAYANERQQASDFVDTFVASPVFQALPPEMALKILSLLVKLKNLGPIGEQIAETLDPQMDQDQLDPQKAMALLKHAQEVIIPTLQQEIHRLEQEQQAKVAETQGKIAVAEKQNEGRIQVETIKAAAGEGEAKLQAATDIEVQQLRNEIEELKLIVQTKIAGAQLEQQTAMEERGRESSERQANANRASSDRNAGEDRRLKGETAAIAAKAKAAKPRGGTK